MRIGGKKKKFETRYADIRRAEFPTAGALSIFCSPPTSLGSQQMGSILRRGVCVRNTSHAAILCIHAIPHFRTAAWGHASDKNDDDDDNNNNNNHNNNGNFVMRLNLRFKP